MERLSFGADKQGTLFTEQLVWSSSFETRTLYVHEGLNLQINQHLSYQSRSRASA